MAENTKKAIIVLLVLAILFSAVSIFTSFAALNVDFPESGNNGVSGQIAGGGQGNLDFVVEGQGSLAQSQENSNE